MFSCPHECCRSLPFIQLALHSSFHGRALWWVCGRVVSSGPCQVQCASLICLKFWGWSWGSLRILVLSGRSWCCSLAFSIRAIASCGVSRLLKRCPVRTCLCSCCSFSCEIAKQTCALGMIVVWTLLNRGKKSPSVLQRGSVKSRLCD